MHLATLPFLPNISYNSVFTVLVPIEKTIFLITEIKIFYLMDSPTTIRRRGTRTPNHRFWKPLFYHCNYSPGKKFLPFYIGFPGVFTFLKSTLEDSLKKRVHSFLFYDLKKVKKIRAPFLSILLLPTAGIEPATQKEQILSLSCLPISPSGFFCFTLKKIYT